MTYDSTSIFLCLLLGMCVAGCQRATDSVPTSETSQNGTRDTVLQTSTSKPATRKFEFNYNVVVTQVPAGKTARIWIPVATSNHDQKVDLQVIDVPGKYRQTVDASKQISLLYLEVQADQNERIPIAVKYVVERHELTSTNAEAVDVTATPTFLAASSMVPVDGSILNHIVGKEKPTGNNIDVARQIYDAVDAKMRYDKPTVGDWGRGDAAWACGSGFGNCTDFHSMFIAACRDCNIPAKFEIGFPLPNEHGNGKIGGYHCWAKFVDDNKWRAVDISEADKNPALKDYYFGSLTADRVTFSVGRDLTLEPKQAAGPVNYIVYPYVEIDGLPHLKMEKNFSYSDTSG